MDWTPSWTPPADSGITVRMQETGGLHFELAEAGAGDHLALCLHGFPELNFSWRFQMPLLAAMGYRVWAPNLRGYGASSRPDGVEAYAIESLLGDVAAVIDVSGAKRVTLIAHDWGGALAWMFAIRKIRPIERLVVMNLPHPALFAEGLKMWKQRRKSWYIAFFQLPWLPERMLTRNRAAAIRRMFRGMAIDKTRFSDEVLDVYAGAALRPGAATAMINWYRAAARGGKGALGRGKPVVDVPTLVVWGEEDAALGVELLDGTERFVPDLTIRRLPRVSHWVQQEAPEAVNTVLKEWLPPASSSSPRP